MPFLSFNLDEANRIGLTNLQRFTAVSRPKPIPEQSLRALFAGLDLSEDLIGDPRSHEAAVAQLKYAVDQELNRLVIMLDNLREGPHYWREPLISGQELQGLRTELNEYKNFLGGIQPLNTPGKLRNFALGQGEVRHALRTRKTVQEVNRLYELLGGLANSMDYIYLAETTLPASDSWQRESARVRDEQLGWLRSTDQRGDSSLLARLKGGLANLKDGYIQRYLELHRLARLDATQDSAKKRLTGDTRWGQMRILSGLDFLSRSELQKLEERLGELRSCPSLSVHDLRTRPFCPSCGLTPRTFNPDTSAGENMLAVEHDFEHLYIKWMNGLRENLKSESSLKNLEMIVEREREQIHQFIRSGQLPEKLNDRFVAACVIPCKVWKKSPLKAQTCFWP